jgi:hypothetical protein
METSFQANGSILGTNVKETGTYWTVVRPDGTLYGEGQGVMITKDGKVATWTGHGVGTTKKDGTGELSRCRLLPNFAPTMGPAEQGRGGIRIRSRRRGQHTLRILGMEIVRSEILIAYPAFDSDAGALFFSSAFVDQSVASRFCLQIQNCKNLTRRSPSLRRSVETRPSEPVCAITHDYFGFPRTAVSDKV